jgi:hypothetical protein
MTFGCEAGELDGYFAGYIEFAFRDAGTAQQFPNYQRLFDGFERWVRESPHAKDFAAAILRSLEPRAARISYPGRDGYAGVKICLVYNARTHQDAGHLLELFFGWSFENQPPVAAA